MRTIPPSADILTPLDGDTVIQFIERCGRTCYKSEDKITDGSAARFVTSILARGHESVIEHVSATVRFTVDRGISHELVRHRLASYSQESTRYCNYGHDDEITVIRPPFWAPGSVEYGLWTLACETAESTYLDLLARGARPQEARSVLPNSLKTEVVMTANLREWRHFFRLRTDIAAHPQMREVTIPLLFEFQAMVPVVFDDIEIDPKAVVTSPCPGEGDDRDE